MPDVSIPIMSPGHLLSAYRTRHRLTQEELADAAEISAQSVHNYEHGKSEPSAKVWARLIAILDIPESAALAIWTK